MTASAASLAHTLATHDDETVQNAILLLVSQRPTLQESLLTILQEPPAQRYTGVIKSFWPDRKFGFIACDELKEQFGADVFLSDQEIGGFTIGMAVNFSVALNKNGRPQAKLLEASGEGAGWQAAAAGGGWQAASGGSGWQAGQSNGGWVVEPPKKAPRLQQQTTQPLGSGWTLPAGNGWFAAAEAAAQADMAGEQATEADPAAIPGIDEGAGDETRHLGMIKSFWPDKRYGFIACDELREAHGGDVFLSDQEINGLAPGTPVTFTITFNKNGRPQAHQLQAAEQG
mmetsp:Transcript_62939/g.142263  ORF Transcript_62939/g.142263 Transcript_62939/m.142263 type:complete len:286 (-) Transcript_62939:93-950(-)